MKKLILFCTVFFMLSACANSQQEQNTETTKTTTKEVPAKTTTTKAATTTSDAKAKTSEAPARRSNVIKSTSRPKSEIEHKFPYDIDFKTADGKIVNSAEALKSNGKPTIVLFWLTTCYPCRMEMKAIHEKFPQWKDETDFNLVAISTDFPKNYENFCKKVKDSGWKWETYNDVNREFRYVMPGGLNGLPQTFIMDENGEIVYHKRKYSTGDEDKLYEKVKQLASK